MNERERVTRESTKGKAPTEKEISDCMYKGSIIETSTVIGSWEVSDEWNKKEIGSNIRITQRKGMSGLEMWYFLSQQDSKKGFDNTNIWFSFFTSMDNLLDFIETKSTKKDILKEFL